MADDAALRARLDTDDAQREAKQLIAALEKLYQASKRAEGGEEDLNRQSKSLAGGLGSLKGIVVGVAGSLALREAVRGTARLIELGSAVGEVASKFETVTGPAIGEASLFLDDFATKAGLARVQGEDLLATTAAMGQGFGFARDESVGFAKEVLRLAGDLASFNNLPTADTLRSIQSATAGEFESLKRLGIVIRATDVEQRALNDTGKASADLLNQQDRAAAALALAYEKAGVQVGDLDRTSDSLANQLKQGRAEFVDYRNELGIITAEAFEQSGALEIVQGSVAELADTLRDHGPAMAESLEEVFRAGAQVVAMFGELVELGARWLAFVRTVDEQSNRFWNAIFGLDLPTGEAREAIHDVADTSEYMAQVTEELREHQREIAEQAAREAEARERALDAAREIAAISAKLIDIPDPIYTPPPQFGSVPGGVVTPEIDTSIIIPDIEHLRDVFFGAGEDAEELSLGVEDVAYGIQILTRDLGLLGDQTSSVVGQLAGSVAALASGNPVGAVSGLFGIVDGLNELFGLGSTSPAEIVAGIEAWEQALRESRIAALEHALALEYAANEARNQADRNREISRTEGRDRRDKLLAADRDRLGDLATDFRTLLESSRARLGGDSIEEARVLGEADISRQLDQYRELLDTGRITSEQFGELERVLRDLLDESLIGMEGAAKAAADALEQAEAAERERIASISRSLDLEQLRLEGNDEAARALQNEIEIIQAVAEGYTEAQIAQLEHIQQLREEARAVAEAAQAAEEAARAVEELARLQDLENATRADIEVRKLLASGLEDEANLLRLKIRQEEELNRLRERGLGEDLLNDLRAVQESELANFLEELARAAEAAAEASARLNRELEEDLDVRELLAKGLDDEAELLRLEIEQRRQLERLKEEGFAQETLDRLKGIQQIELDRLRNSLTDVAPIDEIAGGAAVSGSSSFTFSQGVTEVTAQRMNAIMLSQLAVQQAIAANTAQTARNTTGGAGGGAGIQAINEGLGHEAFRESRLSGRVPVA